ncbi:MAG: M28 family peptidase, partial [Bacteroidetes bacterium]|nr:M28 family peptidase [Bacteroidota bacterium]
MKFEPRIDPAAPDRSASPGVATGLQRLALLLALGILAWMGLLQIQTPTPRSETTPAEAFSAERAMAHLRILAAASRAVGTPGHDAARAYLTEEIRKMGLRPVIQEAPSHVRFEGANGFSAGTVRNVLARIPGQSSTGALAINAHYDSGTTGPGASDCGSCVVTALEAMRAVLAGPPLRNDVIFVFSDAEEDGDLGAAAFAREHPWAESVKLAVNYEAQGSGGAAILYATSEADGWLVGEFLDAAPDVRAYSWMGAIMELYPQGQLECDLAEYTKRGKQGLGFVYLANTTDYHTLRDNIDRIDPGSIQQEGDYTMAFLHHFGNADLTETPRGDNQVFFNALPGVVVRYGYSWVLPIAGLVTLFILIVLAGGFHSGALAPRPVLVATGALGLGTLATVAVGILSWIGIKSLNPDYQVTLIGNYQSDLYTVAFIVLTIALIGALHAMTRRLGRFNVFAGVLLAWLPLLWLISYATPAMSYIASWPLLFGALPLAWAVWTRTPDGGRPQQGLRWIQGSRWMQEPRWVQVAVLSIAAAPAITLLPATLYQAVGLINRFEGAAGLPLFGVMTLFVAPAVVLLIPQLDTLAGHPEKDEAAAHRWRIPVVAGGMAVALIGWGILTSGFDAERPRPSHLAYALNADRGEAQWVSFDRHLGPWTSQFIS